MYTQPQQGIQYGLSIATIGYVLANLIFASALTIANPRDEFMDNLLIFVENDMAYIYGVAAAILLVSGYISGSAMDQLLSRAWTIQRTCVLGSFLVLCFTAILTGITIASARSFSPYRNFDIELLFAPMLVVAAFGLIPSLLTGYLFGKYQNAMLLPEINNPSSESEHTSTEIN